MNFASDCFVQGTRNHPICQDYSLCKDTMFVVSDGCSSSPNTDIGARILSHMFMKEMKNEYMNDNMFNIKIDNIIKWSRDFVKRLEINDLCLDATVLFGTYDEFQERIKIVVIGDGCVFARRRSDDSLVVWDFNYEHNAPYYLSYYSGPRDQGYKEFSKDTKHIKTTRDGFSEEKEELDLFVCPCVTICKDEFYMAGVCSDGIHAFVKEGQILDYYTCLNQLTTYKNTNGEFVKRRCTRVLKDMERDGLLLWDDFSMAVLLDKER